MRGVPLADGSAIVLVIGHVKTPCGFDRAAALLGSGTARYVHHSGSFEPAVNMQEITMRSPIGSTCALVVLCVGASNVAAQPAHALVACDDSSVTGKRPANTPCAVLARKEFSALPSAPLVLRLENFGSVEAARRVATPASTVVEAGGKVWLLTLGSKGARSSSGSFVAEIGPLPAVPHASRYEMRVAEADFGPDMNAMVSKAVHTHSGPEIWYLLTGEQCLELPNGALRARAGEGMIAPAETPMQLNITGTTKRDALFVIVHDAAKPATTVSNWTPKGSCRSS